MIYPPPPAHTSYRDRKLRPRTDYKEVDIYTLSADELLEVWIALQRSTGRSERNVAEDLRDLGVELSELSLGAARDHAVNAKGAAVLTILARDLVRSGNIMSEYYITSRAGKQYIIFKGNHKLRAVLKGTRYLATNTKIMKFGIGGQALKRGAKSGFVISMIFSVSLHTIHWVFEESYRWSNWVVNVSIDATKIALASIAGYLAAKGAAATALAVFGASPVILPIAAGLVVCVGVAWMLNRSGFDEEVERIVSFIEHYENSVRNLDETIADGIYYVIEETGRAVRKSVKRFIFSKVRTLRQGLNSKWLF
ncbi:hypothetical protein [Marinimicrobium alkaliphilum]|uniref:hypothetical protein n=1 Tax=Marinimicrobium alkaliphilum TaxID=2202654 RepID=UPI000DB990BA|nr:hypothetical protein [Marinimicrobium alkaliphilum]